MRNINSITVVSFVLLVSIFAAPASALLPNTVYFDFTGWDHAQIVGGGQTFNIGPGLTVMVEATGAFTVPSSFSNGLIRSGHLRAGDTNEFRFTFNQDLPLVVLTNTVDNREDVRIFGAGSESYFHDAGAPPTVSPVGSGISIIGTGFGINPTGAARGETVTTALANVPVRVEHISLAANKYEQFGIGLVPEPTSLGLLFSCLLGLGVFRKRG